MEQTLCQNGRLQGINKKLAIGKHKIVTLSTGEEIAMMKQIQPRT